MESTNNINHTLKLSGAFFASAIVDIVRIVSTLTPSSNPSIVLFLKAIFLLLLISLITKKINWLRWVLVAFLIIYTSAKIYSLLTISNINDYMGYFEYISIAFDVIGLIILCSPFANRYFKK